MTACLELVAPAGTPAAARAAIEAGADTIYCGFRDCTNARNYPSLNFDLQEMEETVAFAHDKGKKLLVAINSFPRAGEPEAWHKAIDNAASLGVDAVIMADIGLLDYATSKYPDMRRHLSVQAAASNAPSISFYRENFDIKRVVLPRIFSVEEIKIMVEEIDLETEVFCFGSVGTMSEGRCFLSSYMTGMSPSSDGVCAPAQHVTYEEKEGCTHSCLGGTTLNCFGADEPAAYPTPCKGRYLVNEKSTYLFEEPVGWNTLEILPQLKAAGVTALKIEGRQRSRAYVAQVVGTFRKALDAMERGEEVGASDLHTLAEGSKQTTGAYKKGWK
ncbi:MAG TPA: protease [Rhodospirillaceae bacterium]|nr:protease [Rhodospirillaceae bacterium]